MSQFGCPLWCLVINNALQSILGLIADIKENCLGISFHFALEGWLFKASMSCILPKCLWELNWTIPFTNYHNWIGVHMQQWVVPSAGEDIFGDYPTWKWMVLESNYELLNSYWGITSNWKLFCFNIGILCLHILLLG